MHGQASNRYAPLGEDEMDAEAETGENSGGKGGEFEAGRKIVDAVAPPCDNEESDGNSTQRQVLHNREGNVGDRECSDGQQDGNWSTNIANFEAWDTDNTTSRTTANDGEPTESDVVDHVSGSIGFCDRSFGREFVLAGKKKSGTTSDTRMAKASTAGTAMTTMATMEPEKAGVATARVGKATTKLPTVGKTMHATLGHATKKAAIDVHQHIGRDHTSSLSSILARGGPGATGIGKLTLLHTKRENKKVATIEAKGATKTKLEMIREEVVARKNQGTRGIGDSIRQAMGMAVGAMKDRPVVKTAQAVRKTTSSNPKRATEKKAEVTETPRTNNFGNTQTAEQGSSAGSHGYNDDSSNEMEDEDTTVHIPGFETVQANWSEVEEEMKLRDGYQVRYEYSEKASELQRSTTIELFTLAEELWRADPDMEILSFNTALLPITCIDEFPSSTAEYKEFFARVCIQKNSKRDHIFGFYIRTRHPLSKLSQMNGKALQNFLIQRKTWLRQHRFNSLLVEQIGWFACKMAGAHIHRAEYRLQQQLWETAIRLNRTDEFSGANKITETPAFEIARRPVYETDGSSESNSALTIFCESANTELLKTLLVHADLEKNEFGMFMLQSTKLTTPDLHKSMYQEHLAFSQDLIAIAVEGLHLDVLEESIQSTSAPGGTILTVRDALLAAERDGVCPIRALEYTTRSTEEGRFILITTREGADGTKSIVENELVTLAQKTTSFARHMNDSDKFSHGIRLATRRMTRRERHENGVIARQGAWQGDERSQTRQARRQVFLIDAPWTLDDHPLLPPRNEDQSVPNATYAQVTSGQNQPNRLHQLPPTNGRTSPMNQSVASELGFDDAATIQSLISTVVEQSERMQAQGEQMQVLLDGHENFKKNFEVAVELRMRDQHAAHALAIEEMESRQARREIAYRNELQAKEEHLQEELRAMIQHFTTRDQAQHDAKLLADEQQRLREKETNMARSEERSAYEAKVDRLAKKSDDTLNILSEMRQMMAAVAQTSASTQQSLQQRVASTPPRMPTTTQRSLPSRINIEAEMEEASQLTNTLSGVQLQDQMQKSVAEGSFSPPRTEKKRLSSELAASLSTEETQGSTLASESLNGSSDMQQDEPPLDGLITQLEHDEHRIGASIHQERQVAPLASDRAPVVGDLTHLSQQEKEAGKAEIGARDPSIQQGHQETLLFSGTAPDAEALAKFYSDLEDSDQWTQQTKELGKSEQGEHQPSFRQGCKNPPQFTEMGTNVEVTEKCVPKHDAVDQDSAQEPETSEQSKTYENDDPDAIERQAQRSQESQDSSSHQEDRQLESIWEKEIGSANRSDKTHTTASTAEDEQQDSGREKRQRPLANSPWAIELKKAAKSGAVAIVQQNTEPRKSIESPDRKKRAAPSPKRGGSKEEDDLSITSADVDELAKTVLYQIQEALTGAKAPSGPRKND
jgi:hypothetical protein